VKQTNNAIAVTQVVVHKYLMGMRAFGITYSYTTILCDSLYIT